MKNIQAAVQAMEDQVASAESMKLTDFDPNKTSLCVIDINNGFAKAGALYSDRVEAKIHNIAALAEAFLDKDMEVLAYTDFHPEDAKEFSAYPSHCVGDTVESELVDELKPLMEKGMKEIKKNSTNGILSYNPAASGSGKDYVVIGCVTDICVYQYAVTLRAYLNEQHLEGQVYVVEDLVQTFQIDGFHHGDLMHITFLKSMMDNGVKVISSIDL